MKHLLSLFLVCLLTLSPVGMVPQAESSSLPVISITLDGGMNVNSITKEVQTPGVFSMEGEGTEPLTNLPITIKGRGNSTWNLPKKPYQIKFATKTDLLGMGASKKWILLANYWDKTHVRNAMMYSLANKMNEIFSVECEFVDVNINGQYQGCYLLCEKIEFGGQRIDQETEMGAVLMELEQQYRHATEGCAACIITNNGVHLTLKEPEVDETFTQADFDTTKELTLSKLNRIETALTQGYEVYSQMIDVNSFVDWYIQNELAKNYDAAFVTSSYCYLDNQGLLHMGPVWDVDVCFGNQDVTYPNSTDNGLNHYNYRSDKGAWYLQLFQDPTFVSLLKERWRELMNTGMIEGMFEDIDRFTAQIAASKEKDEARWPAAMQVTNVRNQGTGNGGTAYFTFEEEVEYLKDWLHKRVDFLNSQWNDYAFSGQTYTTLAATTGGEIATKGYGTVTQDVWKWNKQGAVNKSVRATAPFFEDALQKGQYLVTAQFTATASKTQDALALRLMGYTADGQGYVIDSTVATHVTYATAEKDQEGFGTLYFPIDLTGYQYDSYALVAEAHSAAGSLGEITLMQSSGVRLGDVTLDGKVNAKDALEVLKFAVGKTPLDDIQQTAAQVDGKQGINAKDALEILKYAVGKIYKFPIEQ